MLAIINARLETISQGIIENGEILIDDGKIVSIGEKVDYPDAETKVIDAEGRTLTPGIIEAHCHVGISEKAKGWAGQDTNESTSPLTPWCRAVDAINMQDDAFEDFRKTGITSANVLPGSGNIIGGTTVAIKCNGDIVDQAVIKNPSGMKAALGENPKGLYGKQNKTPSTRMGNAAIMREALEKARSYHDKLENSDSESDKPDFDRDAEALLPVINGEIPLRIHCHRADDIVSAVRIAEEFDIQYTLEHITQGYQVIDFLKEKNTQNAIGPTIHYGSKVENRDRDFRTPIKVARNDINFCLTTDHPVEPGRNLILTAGLAVNWGMDRDQALRSITLSAAEHIGIDDRVGSLEKGKDADLVLWSDDPLEFTSFTDLTIIDGEIVYERKV